MVGVRYVVDLAKLFWEVGSLSVTGRGRKSWWAQRIQRMLFGAISKSKVVRYTALCGHGGVHRDGFDAAPPLAKKPKVISFE